VCARRPFRRRLSGGNPQFGWLIALQLLILINDRWRVIRRRANEWRSKLRYACTRHIQVMQVQLETIQSGQQRLLDRIDSLKRQN
jgi:hypothetical protein